MKDFFKKIRRMLHNDIICEIKEQGVLNRELLNTVQSISKKMEWEMWQSRLRQDNIRHALMGPIYEDIVLTVGKKQLGWMATLEHIIDTKCSFARFGDGELKLMLRDEYDNGFQKNSYSIQQCLRNVLLDDVDNLLIGFPTPPHSLHWANVWADIWYQLKPLVSERQIWGNSHVSRPGFFRIVRHEGVVMWRKIWDKKRVKIITGENSRFDPIDILFDNVKDIQFEYSVPRDAFHDISRLVEKLAADKNTELFLISLGPAGTILAYELAKEGKWALDIGHINASYLSVFEGAPGPESLPVIIK